MSERYGSAGALGIGVHVHERSLSATPGAFLEDVGPLLESYEHSITRTGGFEGLSVDLVTDLDTARRWLTRLLCPVICYGPAADVIWEGYLAEVSLAVGNERLTLGLSELANAVRVRYQPDIGAQVATAFATDADSTATYGRKELIYSGSGMSTTAAIALRDTLLGQRRWPVSSRAGGAGSKAEAGEVKLSLSGAGWASCLSWLTTSSSTSAVAVTTTQLQNLITAYVATNPFYSTDYRGVASSGLSDTQWIEPDTTYQAKIARLMSLGNSAGELLAWGCYEGRRWKVNTWAGATPTTIAYRRSLGDGTIYDAYGAPVAPWLVRPDAMYQVVDLVEVAPPSGVIDSAAAYYAERVSCSVEGGGVRVRLEPARSSELDVLLARIRN